MEDLGFYLANYSAAQCISWGYQQGCGFVTSRCGVMLHDYSIDVTSAAQCGGDPFWESSPRVEPGLQLTKVRPRTPAVRRRQLRQRDGPVRRDVLPRRRRVTPRLQRGAGDRGRARHPRYDVRGPAARGDGVAHLDHPGGVGALRLLRRQLHTARRHPHLETAPLHTARPNPARRPPHLDAACKSQTSPRARETSAARPAHLASHVATRSRVVCPSNERARTIALIIGVFVELCAATICGGSLFVLFNYDLYAAFIARTSVVITAAGSGGFAGFGALVLFGVARRNRCICTVAYWSLPLLTPAVAGTLFLGYWVWSSDDIVPDTINAIRGTKIETHVQSFDDWLSKELAVPLSVVEAALCSTYTLCCRDPALDGLATTTEPSSARRHRGRRGRLRLRGGVHRGRGARAQQRHLHHADGHAARRAGGDVPGPVVAQLLRVHHRRARPLIVAPPRGTCNLIDRALDGFSLSTCQADFCTSGVDAYITFVNQMVALIQNYAVPLACGMGMLVLMLLIWATNVRYVGKALAETTVTSTKFTVNVDGTAQPNYGERRDTAEYEV